jgi:hypothetical protein
MYTRKCVHLAGLLSVRFAAPSEPGAASNPHPARALSLRWSIQLGSSHQVRQLPLRGKFLCWRRGGRRRRHPAMQPSGADEAALPAVRLSARCVRNMNKERERSTHDLHVRVPNARNIPSPAALFAPLHLAAKDIDLVARMHRPPSEGGRYRFAFLSVLLCVFVSSQTQRKGFGRLSKTWSQGGSRVCDFDTVTRKSPNQPVRSEDDVDVGLSEAKSMYSLALQYAS